MAQLDYRRQFPGAVVNNDFIDNSRWDSGDGNLCGGAPPGIRMPFRLDWKALPPSLYV